MLFRRAIFFAIFFFLIGRSVRADYNAVGIGTIMPQGMIDVEQTNTSTTADTYAEWINNSVAPTAATAKSGYGLVSRVTSSSAYAISNLYGIDGQCVDNSTGALTTTLGVSGETFGQSTGTISSASLGFLTGILAPSPRGNSTTISFA